MSIITGKLLKHGDLSENRMAYARLIGLLRPTTPSGKDALLDHRHKDRANEVEIRRRAGGLVEKVYKQHLNWLQLREFHLLIDAKQLLPGSRVGAYKQAGEETDMPDSTRLVMTDCGLDLDDWIALLDFDLASPWRDARFHLALWRGLLQSLLPFHGKGFVHCDLRSDNVCLPFRRKATIWMPWRLNGTLDVHKPWLIDLALSLCPGQLPPVSDKNVPGRIGNSYVSPHYTKAWEGAKPIIDAVGKTGLPPKLGLDWRVDFYSFGDMVQALLLTAQERGVSLWDVPMGCDDDRAYRAAYDYLIALPRRLRSYDTDPATHEAPQLPHQCLIDEIGGLIGSVWQHDRPISLGPRWPRTRKAWPPRIGSIESLASFFRLGNDEVTDLTPPDPAPPPPDERTTRPLWLAAGGVAIAGLAIAGAVYDYSARQPVSGPVTPPATVAKPPVPAPLPLTERAAALAKVLLDAHAEPARFHDLLAVAAPDAAEHNALAAATYALLHRHWDAATLGSDARQAARPPLLWLLARLDTDQQARQLAQLGDGYWRVAEAYSDTDKAAWLTGDGQNRPQPDDAAGHQWLAETTALAAAGVFPARVNDALAVYLGKGRAPDPLQAIERLAAALKGLDRAGLSGAPEGAVDYALAAIENATALSTRPEVLAIRPQAVKATLPGLARLAEFDHLAALSLLGYVAACRAAPADTATARRSFGTLAALKQRAGEPAQARTAERFVRGLDERSPELCRKLTEFRLNAAQSGADRS